MKWLLVLGAESDIAKAVVRRFAKDGVNFYLAHFDTKEIKDFSKDVAIRFNVEAIPVEFDAMKYATHQKFYEKLNPKPDGVLCVFGYLGDNVKALKDFKEAERIIDVNYKGAVSILNIVASDFIAKKSGWIAAISSVAGDRGRQSNFLYGSAKAGLTAYLSGLRNLACKQGVQVLTIKPGFVNTKMTRGMDLPKKLMAEPEEVAESIYKAWKKKKDVLYTKWIWRYIMLIIIHIPERIFKKLSL